MGKTQNRRQAVNLGILKALGASGPGGKSFMIVDITIIGRLLDSMPLEALQQFLLKEFSDAPQVTDPRFGTWVKLSRDKHGISQRAFAARLAAAEGIKIYGSDIGNLELGHRSEDYTPERLTRIRSAIIGLKVEAKAT